MSELIFIMAIKYFIVLVELNASNIKSTLKTLFLKSVCVW